MARMRKGLLGGGRRMVMRLVLFSHKGIADL